MRGVQGAERRIDRSAAAEFVIDASIDVQAPHLELGHVGVADADLLAADQQELAVALQCQTFANERAGDLDAAERTEAPIGAAVGRIALNSGSRTLAERAAQDDLAIRLQHDVLCAIDAGGDVGHH